MREAELMTLIRSTLLAGFVDIGQVVAVEQRYQPGTQGMDSGANVGLMLVTSNRYGHMKRRELQPVAPATDFTHEEIQWWETTIQVSALARVKPEDYLTQPTAMDIAKMASDILQGDKGLTAMAVERVRPLRVTSIRQIHFVNDSDQYEANPSFDITLSHVQTTVGTTPPVSQYEPIVGRV